MARLPAWKKLSNRPTRRWRRGMGDRCSEIHLKFGVAGNPDPPVRRSLGAQRLHHIDARHACRRHYPRDNRDRHVDALPESAGGGAGQALQVLDRFHITTHLNQAVDQVRRGESTSLRARSKPGATNLQPGREHFLTSGAIELYAVDWSRCRK